MTLVHRRLRSLSIRDLAILAALVAILPGAHAAPAEPYPSRPITLVVPFPPGGSNDMMARIISKGLGEALRQPIVVDNRGGAGGNLGASAVARAAPDGYTLAIVSSTFASNAAIQPKIPYDAVKSFAPVGMLARSPLVVAVNLQFAAHNPRELLDVIRKNPGKYNYASGGSGSLSHFSTELLKVQAGGLEITHVPYKGTGPVLTDLIGNQTQVFIASAPILLPMVRSGKIRGVGITSLEPSAIAPDLLPVATAVPGYHYETWWGILAPAGTPAPVVEKLNTALNSTLRSAEVRASFLKEGAEPAPGTPAQFGSVIAQDLESLRTLARQQNIVAD